MGCVEAGRYAEVVYKSLVERGAGDDPAVNQERDIQRWTNSVRQCGAKKAVRDQIIEVGALLQKTAYSIATAADTAQVRSTVEATVRRYGGAVMGKKEAAAPDRRTSSRIKIRTGSGGNLCQGGNQIPDSLCIF